MVITTDTNTSQAEHMAQFTKLDNSKNPRWFIDFMDAANDIPQYSAANRALTDELGNMKGKRILDLGCGTGDDARDIVSRFPEVSEVVGIDLSAVMIEEARLRSNRSNLAISFTQGNGSCINYPDHYFDSARSKLVLMHCEDIDTTFAEMIRVVKPGGRIAVFDFDFDTMTVDHPNVLLTREAVSLISNGVRNHRSGRQLFSRFVSKGLASISVKSYTMLYPLDFFKYAVSGHLSEGRKNSTQTIMTEQDEIGWWNDLHQLASKGLFFASLTGFLVSGTKPI